MTTASELTNRPGTDVSALFPIRRATPPSPNRIPASKREFQCHCFAAAAESKKTQIGSLAISREARPEGTFCSAQCNEPWPMRKKKTPMTILARICAQVGRRRSARHQRSEEHTSELQSRFDLVCRLLLEKKNTDLLDSNIST